jgi:hypothetical protein
MRALTAKYFELYARKDLSGLQQMWSEQSPAYAASRQAAQKHFAESSTIEVKSLRLGKVEVEGERARVGVSLELIAIDSRVGQRGGVGQ